MRILVSDWGHLDDVLPVALAHGVGIEILEFASPEAIDGGAAPAEIAGKLQGISLRGFHGPFSELVPASRDRKIQEVTRSRFQSAYELATAVGAQHLVLHTGYIPKTYPRQTWLENSARFWVDWLAGKQGSVAIHVENVYEDEHSLLAELLDRVNEALQREALSACLDIGHVQANSSRPLGEWIASLGARIRYVHLHNNDGTLDDHYGLSRGGIDVAAALDGLLLHGPDALWTVETPGAEVEGSLSWLQERGYL